MFGFIVEKILSFLNMTPGSAETPADARRRHIRHDAVHADVAVGPSSYSVRDWSLGGVSFETLPDSRLMVGDRLSFTLRFNFPHGAITIEQPGRIVRTSRRGTAAEFGPLPVAVRRQFDRVIDSLNAQNFLDSQAA